MANFLKNLFSPRADGSSTAPKAQSTEQLIEQLNSSYEDQEAALTALLNSGDPRLADLLIEALSHPSPWLRQGAAKALGRLREPRAVPALLRNLPRSQDDIEVHSGEVVEALGEIGDPAAVEPLARLFGDTLPSALALTLPEALAKLGDRRSMTWLLNRIDSENWADDVRLEAAKSLDKILNEGDRDIVEKAVKQVDARLELERRNNKDTSGTERVLEVMERILMRVAPEASELHVVAKAARPDPAKVEALFRAASDGDSAKVSTLLAEGVDPNGEGPGVRGETAILRAADYGHADVARALLESGANVDAIETREGRTALINAAESGHLEVVQLLLEHGPNTDIQTRYTRETALMCAARMGRSEVARALVERDADPNIVSDHDHSTALIRAMCNGRKEIAMMLIDKDADITIEGTFCGAIISKDADIVQALIDKGADANQVSHVGWSPLMHAAADELTEIARLLVRNGAKVHANDRDAWERLKAANRENHDKMMYFLAGVSAG